MKIIYKYFNIYNVYCIFIDLNVFNYNKCKRKFILILLIVKKNKFFICCDDILFVIFDKVKILFCQNICICIENVIKINFDNFYYLGFIEKV